MSFSQKYGFAPPVLAQVETVSDDLRNGLWNAMVVHVWDAEISSVAYAVAHDVAKLMWYRRLKQRLDDMSDHRSSAIKQIRAAFFELNWFQLLDFVEYFPKILSFASNDQEEAKSFRTTCNRILEEENSAYRFVGRDLAPLADRLDQEAVAEAVEDLSGLPGARTHVAHAISLLSKRPIPDYRNSIKESISAVEAVARHVTGDPKATLGEALKLIKLHPALKSSFSSLYGYASDESGIRHALADDSKVGLAEARLLVITCSAFCSYLMAKVVTPSSPADAA